MRSRFSGGGQTLPMLAVALLLTALLGVYAVQTVLGHWQVDEFRYFAANRALGWRAYFDRLPLSPRPVSELLIHWYGVAALTWNAPLVAGALLSVWAGCLLAMVGAAFGTMPGRPRRLVAAIVLGLSPMLLVLQTGPVTELFYWPVATLAYLPMLAAITCVLFLVGAAGDGAAWRGWCGAALLVAMGSHEIGAAFAIGFGGVAALLAVRDGRGWRMAWWWAGPAVAGLLVMLVLVLFRSEYVDLGSDTKPYTGRLLASAGAAVRQMLEDVVTVSGTGLATTGGLAVLQKAAFACGFGLVWRGRPNRWWLAMAGGLGVAVFFSLLAAFYHYGDLCCERQETARQWLIALGYVLAATAGLSRWNGAGRVGAWLGPLLLLASLLPVIGQAPRIRADFAMLGAGRQARARTWQSGLGAGSTMEFYMPPESASMLIHGTSIPLGRYEATDESTGDTQFMAAVGRFFGKGAVFACHDWQTGDSFMMNGQFIPACPPHEGPPDYIVNGATVDLGPGSRAEIAYRRAHPVPGGRE